jgi:hypothetical protein
MVITWLTGMLMFPTLDDAITVALMSVPLTLQPASGPPSRAASPAQAIPCAGFAMFQVQPLVHPLFADSTLVAFHVP